MRSVYGKALAETNALVPLAETGTLLLRWRAERRSTPRSIAHSAEYCALADGAGQNFFLRKL